MPPRLWGLGKGWEPWCQFQTAEAGLPEAGLQTAPPCDFSVGQLFSKEDEVIRVPIFTFSKHSDKPVWSMGYPISCIPAKDTHTHI